MCERVKKSLVLFGERQRERGLPRNLNIKERERELEFFCFCFFCVWVLRVMVAVHVDRVEGMDGEDWVLWGRRGGVLDLDGVEGYGCARDLLNI